MFKLSVVLPIVLVCCAGCAAPEPVEEGPYFPPKARFVEEGDYVFDAEQRRRALREFEALGADTLFELVVNDRGEVSRCALLRSAAPRYYHDEIEAQGHGFRFPADPKPGRHRAFFMPIRYQLDLSFEYADDD